MKNNGKVVQIEKIAKALRDLDQSPLYQYRIENDYLPVLGEGDPDARIMFIGEAPGKREAQVGRPFVGRAGRLLDQLLESIDLDRADVYITNVVKDRPPNNRDPHRKEIESYAPLLEKEINIVQPQVFATLGRFAMNFVLEKYDHPRQGQKIGDLHGEKLEVETSYGKVTFVPLYHPAAAFYNRDLRETMQDDFERLKTSTQ